MQRYLKLVADLGVSVEGALEFPLPMGDRPLALPKGGCPQASGLTSAGEDRQEACPPPGSPGFLLLHPFSRGHDKSLAQEDLESLCVQLQPIPVVVVGRSELKLNLPENCISLLNQTSISELIWLIRHADFTLSVDSGPMHIAAAMTGRLLGIHTWTDPRIVGPCHPEAWVWKNGALIQVKSLETATSLDGTQAFTSRHLPAVVDFLKNRIT